MSTEAKESKGFKPLGAIIAVIGAGLIGAGVLGIERGVTFLFGNFTLFGGIALFMYQTFVQE